jgi:CMP-N-acetylneuraminic acid synthetase
VIKPTIIALVPMRHHSQRVPGKNYRLLAGKPLFHHILNTLLDCSEIFKVVVDTDSPVILDDLGKNFPTIVAVERPEHLRADHLPMNEILAYDTGLFESGEIHSSEFHSSETHSNTFHSGDIHHPAFFLQTHSTNPLIQQGTISSAIRAFTENYPAYDSLFSVTRLQTRLWDQLGRAINHNPAILLQTQDLPPVYEENSCIYMFTRANLISRRNRLGERPMMFEVDAAEAWDIDEELDFLIADLILSQRKLVHQS